MDPDPEPGGPKKTDPDSDPHLRLMDPDPGGPKTPTDPNPQHCLFGGAKAALGGNLLEEAEVGEAARREAAVEEGHGSGQAVAEGAQLTLLRVYAQTSFYQEDLAFSYAQSRISFVFCRSLGFLVHLSSSLTAESDLACVMYEEEGG
jgi:hypothetical protein